MKDKNLLKRLRKLGFPLFETEEAEDANLTLADVVRSRDLRFWEGFPVVLATSANNGLFDYNKTVASLKKVFDKPLLGSLVAMSLALYKDLGLSFPWADSLRGLLRPEKKDEYAAYLAAFQKGDDLNVGGRMMSSARLTSLFNNYYRKESEGLRDLLSAKEDLGLEYALSQVFSPKQKELFLKKLKGEVLTKTEKEYFSRAVKKKVAALANAELHRLARKLLGE